MPENRSPESKEPYQLRVVYGVVNNKYGNNLILFVGLSLLQIVTFITVITILHLSSSLHIGHQSSSEFALKKG